MRYPVWYPMLVALVLTLGFVGVGLFTLASRLETATSASGGAASGLGALGPLATIVAALFAAAAALWVGFRTQGVTSRVAEDSRKSQERLACDQQKHQLQMTREQFAFQERQAREDRLHQQQMADRAHRHEQRLAEAAQAAQLQLAQQTAARTRRERRIDPFVAHFTKQTSNITRVLNALETGQRAEAQRWIEAVVQEKDSFQEISPGLVNEPAFFHQAWHFAQVETLLRNLTADRYELLSEGRPLPHTPEIEAAYAELIFAANALEKAIEAYIIGSDVGSPSGQSSDVATTQPDRG